MQTNATILLAAMTVLTACASDSESPGEEAGTDSAESTGVADTEGLSTTGMGTATMASTGTSDTDLPGSTEDSSESGDPGDTGSSSTGEPSSPFSVELIQAGFAEPESAHFHPASGSWFVSNVAGESGAPDGMGWVTRLDRDGTLLDEQWVAGLDSPAGITSDGSQLYVSDINRIHVFDIETAQEVDTIAVENAAFLNDPAFGPDGTLYVSDSFAQAIYAIDADGTPVVAAADKALDFPNGLMWRDDHLLIASIGPFTDFRVDGPLHTLDVETGALSVVRGVRGKFDGIVQDETGIWMTDFRGSLLRLEGEEVVAYDLTEHGLASSADLGYDVEEGALMIPDLLGGQVALVRLAR